MNDKSKKGTNNVETPLWLKRGIAGSFALPSDVNGAKMMKAKSNNKAMEKDKASESLPGLDEKIMDLTIENVSLSCGKDDIKEEFDTYKKKTEAEMKRKDDLISVLLEYNNAKEMQNDRSEEKEEEVMHLIESCLELVEDNEYLKDKLGSVKNGHSEEVANLIEVCLDLLESNDYLKGELKEAKKEFFQAMIEMQDENMWLRRENEEVKDTNLAIKDELDSWKKLPGDVDMFSLMTAPNKSTNSLSALKVSPLFSPMQTKAEMLFGAGEQILTSEVDENFLYPEDKIPRTDDQGIASELKPWLLTPFSSPAKQAASPALSVIQELSFANSEGLDESTVDDVDESSFADAKSLFVGADANETNNEDEEVYSKNKNNFTKFWCIFPWLHSDN